MDLEEPVACGDCSSFDFYPTLPGRPGATLGGHQVVQMGQPSKQRLVAASWRVKALHRAKFPLHGVLGLIQQGAHHGHRRVFAHRIPPRLLVLQPAPDARPRVPPLRCESRARQRGVTAGRVQTPVSLAAVAPGPTRCASACERQALRTGDAMAASCFGSLMSAWRRQLPRRAPGQSGGMLWVVLSKPAVRMPRTRSAGSSCEAARCNS